MKQTRLFEIIREEIASALREGEAEDRAAKAAAIKAIDAKQKALDAKERDIMKGGALEEEEELNEIPDFGGQLDQGVATKYGEEDTLQNAVDAIVGETLADMGVTLEDLKKDEAKATEALTSIREKVLGAKRKGISQDPRVVKALDKQQDVEVDKFGAISGKDLQANQTNNAIKKALGLVAPDKRGKKADPNKPEKAPSTGKKGRPAGEPKAKVATRTAGDDGFDNVSYSDEDEEVAAATKAISGDETAKDLGKIAYSKKLTPEEETQYETALKGIKAKIKRIEDGEEKPDDRTLLKKAYQNSEIQRLFKAKGSNLNDILKGIIG